MDDQAAATSDRQIWDRHWQAMQGESSLFGRLASLVRRRILRGAVRHYAERWLPPTGVLVEAGCGTGEASAGLPRRQRRLLGLDFSLPVLLVARRRGPYDWCVVGDLHQLPFAAGAISGAWNLGVLEHFPAEEGIRILRELRRSLVPGGVAVLFWPPELGLSRWVLAPVEAVRSLLGRRRFRFFPGEVNRLRTRRQGRATLAAAGLEPLCVEVSPRDAFIHMVLVARRAA